MSNDLSLILLVKERIANIGIPLDIFAVSIIFCITSLLGIMRELAGGGSLAVAVGVSDR